MATINELFLQAQLSLASYASALSQGMTSLRVGVWETDATGELILGDPTAAVSLKSLEELGIQSISLGSTVVADQAADGGGNTKLLLCVSANHHIWEKVA